MKTKLLSSLRTSVALLFIALQLPLMSLSMASASASEVCNDSNSLNKNSICYWQAQGYGTCTKDDGPFTSTTYTLPTAPAGQTYSLLVVNGGSNDATYLNPTAGTAYSTPTNGGGQAATVSHAIYCTETTSTPVTPTGVTFVDLCGTGNDTYTVPSTTGVTYHLSTAGGTTVAANTYPGTGTVTVVAVANTGFTLTGTTSWSHTFTDVACDNHVTPAVVTFNDVCGTADDTYTVPTTTGVTYHLGTAGGPVVLAGSHAGNGSVTVVAVANQGFVLDGTTSWSHTFTNEECATDLCPNIPGLQTELTTGIVQQNDNTCKVVICHATAAVKNPYVREIVAVDSVDGISGNNTGGQGDHFLEHTGPIFDPATNVNGDNWGDIIPPVYGLHNGLNWTTEGQAIWNDECDVPTPPVDVCPNIEGLQLVVPAGKVLDNEGNCVTPPTDVCPNIQGVQTEVPAGMVVDENDDCVTPPTDVCPNIEGVQTSVPTNMVKDQFGNCITPGSGGEVLSITTTTPTPTAPVSAAQLVNTGSAALLNLFAGMFLVGVAGVVTFLSRKSQNGAIQTSWNPTTSA